MVTILFDPLQPLIHNRPIQTLKDEKICTFQNFNLKYWVPLTLRCFVKRIRVKIGCQKQFFLLITHQLCLHSKFVLKYQALNFVVCSPAIYHYNFANRLILYKNRVYITFPSSFYIYLDPILFALMWCVCLFDSKYKKVRKIR